MVYTKEVEIIGRAALDRFAKAHPNARPSFRKWITVVAEAEWRNFAELRATFPSADYVRPYAVFNIGGNKFRLVGLVDYWEKTVRVSDVMTHAEYDREAWKK